MRIELSKTSTPQPSLKELKKALDAIYKMAKDNPPKGNVHSMVTLIEVGHTPILLRENGNLPEYCEGNRSITVSIQEYRSDAYHITKYNESREQ